jgi:cyclin B
MGHAAGSENLLPEKLQMPAVTTSVLGDATNTYCTGHSQVDAADHAKVSKTSTLEQHFGQGFPTPPAEGEMDGIAVQQDNPQHVAEYMQDIFDKLRIEESVLLVAPTYMERQIHVNAKMRAILVDWLVDVHKKYKMRPETLFLAVQLTDRYLDAQIVAQRHLQLVGVTALMLAAKFEEVYPPQIKEFVNVTDKAYSSDDIRKMEVNILQAVQFKVCCPTAMQFLDRYQSVNGCTDTHRDLTQYLLELALVEYKMLKYSPSHLAAASILLSNKLLRRPSWTPATAKHTKMTEPMLKECAKDMCAILESAETNTLQAVQRKFSQVKHHSVAKLNFMVGPGSQVGGPASARSVRRSTGVAI